VEPVSCAPLGYLEILDKAGRVTRRSPVHMQTLRIGRAFDNDVIVDDPYVCPYHGQLIMEEGQPKMADLQSLNGIADVSGRPLPNTVSLAGGHVVHLGSTPFRFRAMDHPLEPTLVATRNNPLQLLFKRLFLWAVFLLTLGTILLDTYTGSTEKFELLKQAPVLFGVVILIVIWSTLWSFASRVVAHRWHFWIFCGTACLGLLFSVMAETGTEYLCFALALDGALPWANHLNLFLATGTVLYLNLRLISSATGALLARFAAGIALTLVLLTWGMQYSEQENFNSSPVYRVTLKAPFWKVSGSRTTEEFFKQGEALFDALDEERAAD
jgi:pSer/pThr/pTyr-binding forkhead associated (FHA) protein